MQPQNLEKPDSSEEIIRSAPLGELSRYALVGNDLEPLSEGVLHCLDRAHESGVTFTAADARTLGQRFIDEGYDIIRDVPPEKKHQWNDAWLWHAEMFYHLGRMADTPGQPCKREIEAIAIKHFPRGEWREAEVDALAYEIRMRKRLDTHVPPPFHNHAYSNVDHCHRLFVEQYPRLFTHAGSSLMYIGETIASMVIIHHMDPDIVWSAVEKILLPHFTPLIKVHGSEMSALLAAMEKAPTMQPSSKKMRMLNRVYKQARSAPSPEPAALLHRLMRFRMQALLESSVRSRTGDCMTKH